MPLTLRPATQDDEKKIKTLIHQTGINPMNLDWERFIVAEDSGEFVGCGQLKPHKDGALELASLAVTPERQGAGIGATLIKALIERAPGELYLTCRDKLVTYYQRFGFEKIGLETMPRSFKVIYRASRILSKIAGEGISVMRRGG
ncbi:MAG: GNAT family N-acetyltransferase [Chloroflexi bacterium]|nr:GNAT family N-acetyltransferase [Chloroflexota bacterium]